MALKNKVRRGFVLNAFEAVQLADRKKMQHSVLCKDNPREDEIELVNTPSEYFPTRVARNGEEYPGKAVYGVATADHGWTSPFGRPGDVLFIREPYTRTMREDGSTTVLYAAAWWGQNVVQWNNAGRMRFEQARMTVKLTSVKLQRLDQITEAGWHLEGKPAHLSVEEFWDMRCRDLKYQRIKETQYVWTYTFYAPTMLKGK